MFSHLLAHLDTAAFQRKYYDGQTGYTADLFGIVFVGELTYFWSNWL
ncbi:MAG: hypothetical protein AB1801_20255 [Chloroflexota bacterium]